jgi:hypothetical protein
LACVATARRFILAHHFSGSLTAATCIINGRRGFLFLGLCALVLLAQAAIGVLGFLLHGMADLHGPSANLFQNVVHDAPPFAPLLLPNLVVLALIALWVLNKFVAVDGVLPTAEPAEVEQQS